MPLTVAEVLEHPAYPHVIRNLQPTKKGKVAVANRRGGPLDIAFEVHGSGPNHLVVSQLKLVLEDPDRVWLLYRPSTPQDTDIHVLIVITVGDGFRSF